VREIEENAGKKRIRGLYIVKSRGTAHDSDVHKLFLSDEGITLVPVDPVGALNPKVAVEKSRSEQQKMKKVSDGKLGV
jgi:KaiC/GvpD/RAD55 family RecA-like ATPase